MASSLSLQTLRSFARSVLADSLKSYDGPKDLVLEPDIMRSFDRVIGAILLRDLGFGKMFKLEDDLPKPVYNQRVFIVQGNVTRAFQVANLINAYKASGVDCRYKVLMVPRKLFVCEQIFEQEGVIGYVEIDDFGLGFIPLDDDLLSLEIPGLFKSFFLEKDFTGVHTASMCLNDIQSLFGDIPSVYGLGKVSQMVYDLTKQLMQERGSTNQVPSEIGHLFIFDRDVDYASVLLSQLTYEGLVDEIFGIGCGYVDFGPEVTGSKQTVKLLLTSQDRIFEDIRDRHFANVFKVLSDQAKQLLINKEERQKMSIKEVKQFVSEDLENVQQLHRSLALHVGACEVITKKKSVNFETQLQAEHSLLEGLSDQENISYIEELINRQNTILQTARLLCLLSYTHNGLSSKVFRSLKSQFLHSYGHEHMISFLNLQKLGLFSEQELAKPMNIPPSASKIAEKVVAAMAVLPYNSSFQVISKRLNLIPKCGPNYDLNNPTDLGYVYSGAYIPLACSLVKQILLRDGVLGLEETIKQLPGHFFTHSLPKSGRGKAGERSTSTVEPSKKVAFIYFIGGVTFAEVAAFRLLGKLHGYKFIIAATSITNGNKLMASALEEANKLRESPPL